MAASDPLAGVATSRPRIPGLTPRSVVPAAAAPPAPPPLPPPPDLASQGLRFDAARNVVAAKAFAPFETVLDDTPPLLLAPALRPSHPASKPLQAYFEATAIPPSVVLKLAAFLCAGVSPLVSERLAALQCPDPGQGTAADAEARAFAAKLRESPPPVLPTGTIAGWPPSAAAAEQAGGAEAEEEEGEEAEAGRWRELWSDEARTRRGWLLWSAGGRPAPAPAGGSALGAGPWALAHACRGANTVYVAAPAGGWGGRHVALRPIAAGEALTTCYLGTGRGALLVTAPERRARLADEFFMRGGGGCACASCCGDGAAAPVAVDAARGVPCPDCSSHFRGEDRLLTPEAASAAAAEKHEDEDDQEGGGGGGGGGSKKPRVLGYIYRSGPAEGHDAADHQKARWTCDACARSFPDDTAEVWRHYQRSHATIEGQMSDLAAKVDASLDEHGPLSSDVGELGKRVDGVARLLGPRHAAVWRLRLAQAECHAGEAERLMAGLGPEALGKGRMAAALDEASKAFDCLDRVWEAVLVAPFEREGVVLLGDAEEEEGGGGGGDEAAASSPAPDANKTRAAVAAEALAHHAVEICSLAREASALAAASLAEADATAERRRVLSERVEAWLSRVEGALRGAQRATGRAGAGGGGAPSAAAAERSNAQVREIVGKLQRMAAAEGVAS